MKVWFQVQQFKAFPLFRHRCPNTAKRENRSTSPKPSKHPEEPPAKKAKEEKKPEQEEKEEANMSEEKDAEGMSCDASCNDDKREESPVKVPEGPDLNQTSYQDVSHSSASVTSCVTEIHDLS